MPGIERQGDAATCNHPNTGSSKVFANGRGVSVVREDTAGGGLIIGPGAYSVMVGGSPVSLPGDLILPHACCGSPGCGPHCAATTTSESEDVIVGIAWPNVVIEEDDVDQEVSLAPDLITTDVTMRSCGVISPYNDTIVCSGSVVEGNDFLGNTWKGELTITCTVQNLGNTATGPFTVGLWEVEAVFGEDPLLLTLEGAAFIDPAPVLVQTKEIDNINARSFITVEFMIDSGTSFGAGAQYGYWPRGSAYYTVYSDIGSIVFEPDEQNAAPASVFEVI